MLNRRDMLWGMGGFSLALGACGQAGSAQSQHQSERNLLKIPQLLSGKKNGVYTEYNLKIQNGTSTFFEGRSTSTIGVNQAYLGPTLKMDVGSTVRINVNNTLQEDTTLHWHGFHVPAKYDGDDLAIGFNSKYLIDIASEVEDKEITFSLKNSTSPVLVLDNSDKNSFYVIMPMKI